MDCADANGTPKTVKTSGPNKKSNGVPQPPQSTFSAKLVEHLGRKLRSDEASFVRQVQASYHNARSRRLTESDLHLLAGRAHSYNYYASWKGLELWPEFRRNEFLFWLHVAWELRRRNIQLPAFMDGITDLTLIEKQMQEWERQKEIAHWRNWFRDFDGHASLSEPGLLELRLLVIAQEARLQWRIVSTRNSPNSNRRRPKNSPSNSTRANWPSRPIRFPSGAPPTSPGIMKAGGPSNTPMTPHGPP